ncbi:MAG: hypothetical protein GY953_36400 [bacterium]|nr:hypothetical protein [bacterium]
MSQRNSTETDDPVLLMLGVGRRLWVQESGDSFVERLRSEDPPPGPATEQPGGLAENLPEAVWRRIKKHQREQFQTVRGLPFTFAVEGSGIWFFRNEKRINRKLTRGQVEVAISRCALKSTTEIKDLMDYPYLFALLMDRRIRGEAW